MDLKEEEILGDAIKTHWYYVTKGRAMRQMLQHLNPGVVLDVGAGSGVFSRQLLDTGKFRGATCVDPNYPEDRDEIYKGKPLRFRRAHDGLRYKLALMMDVLEHVDDDVALLREYAATLEPGGHVLITVPAFQFLWSGHDVFLEHRRRYTKKMLLETVRKAGCEPVKTRFFFGTLFPVVAAIRLFKKHLLDKGKIEAHSEMKPMSPGMNRALTIIHDIERITLFPVNGLAGLSLFCLCRKK